MIYGNEEYLKSNFERVEGGYLAYKIFNSLHRAPKSWVLENNSWLVEDALVIDPYFSCQEGINVARTVDWIKTYIREECDYCDVCGNDQADVWMVFIPDDADIVVPRRTDGKIRVNRLQLLEIVQQLTYLDDYDEEDNQD